MYTNELAYLEPVLLGLVFQEPLPVWTLGCLLYAHSFTRVKNWG